MESALYREHELAFRTQYAELKERTLAAGAPLPFLNTLQATGLPFVAVPGPPSTLPSTLLKLPDVQGLRVDVLAPGKKLGATVKIPELQWSAQAVPFSDYLLAEPEPAAMLAGGHCIPVRLPQAARFVWHKLYASTQRRGFPEKAAKDRLQALVLAAVLADAARAEQRYRGHHICFHSSPQNQNTILHPLLALPNACRRVASTDSLDVCAPGWTAWRQLRKVRVPYFRDAPSPCLPNLPRRTS